MKLIGFNTSLFYLLIGWSIVCELSYYIFYPFLRSLIDKKAGWQKFLIFSYTPTVLVFLFYPLNLVNYPSVGAYMVVALGLPCWILGLILSFSVDEEPSHYQVTRMSLWCHRILIFSLAFLCHVFALQEIVGHPFTLNFFALAVFFWLKKEIFFYYNRPPNSYLENFGKASYSIYLMHGLPPFIISIFTKDIGSIENFFSYWLILVMLVLLFYLLVEKPTHILSRYLYRSLYKF